MSDYEKVHFEKWQDLAKAVIDGGEIYFGDDKKLIEIRGGCFNYDMQIRDFYIKKQPTLEELIAIKPRLCWVWDNSGARQIEVALIKSVGVDGKRSYVCVGFMSWDNAQMLTDDEIKQFLNGE